MIFRSVIFLLPLAFWAWLIVNQRLSTREITAGFLGFSWSFLMALVLNILFVKIGILTVSVHDNLFYDVPIDWVMSYAIICGSLLPLARLLGWTTRLRLSVQGIFTVTLYTFGGIDIVSTVVFSDDNVTGLVAFTAATVFISFLSVLITALPALYLSDWTANQTHVCKRSFLQSITWMVFLFWLFPSTLFVLTGDSWAPLLQRELWLTGLYLLPLVLPGYCLMSALYHFAVQGGGTAFPYDPPKRLVTRGVYRYISNPMQLGIFLVMGWWGVMLENIGVTVSAFVALMLFIVFKGVCNGSCAIGLDNPEWDRYHRAVPKWFPRMKKS